MFSIWYLLIFLLFSVLLSFIGCVYAYAKNPEESKKYFVGLFLFQFVICVIAFGRLYIRIFLK